MAARDPGAHDKQTAGIVPNLFAAVVIGVGGWIVSRVLRGLAMNLLNAAGADHLPQELPPGTAAKLSNLARTLV
ncbi:hypothetical protein LJR034_001454 [Caballeronia sp. LjRoot34]|uniref:mechanosensitive ion channel family protein n=1 Tax=Caballeronia sp. LjRoot34 TaxID=3342325 RepID=UPI003ECDB9CA